MGRSLAMAVMVAAVILVAIALYDASPDQIDVAALIDHSATPVMGRDPDVPELPFPDNPNPELCGIPVPWRSADDRAWLSGMWEGELIEPEVLLYDSHLRLSISGSAPHGSEVRIVMSQANPQLDFYYVEVEGSPGLAGWVPAPFLSFQRVIA